MTSGVDYAKWPTVPELFPFSSFGVLTNRDEALVSIDRELLEARMRRYFDAEISDIDIAR